MQRNGNREYPGDKRRGRILKRRINEDESGRKIYRLGNDVGGDRNDTDYGASFAVLSACIGGDG